MSGNKIVELDTGLNMHTSSTMDAAFIYREIFQEGTYDNIQLPERCLVVDVGGHIGLFALYVKRRHPDAHLLVFEPSPETAELLRQNVALHQLRDVQVHEVALGATPERGVPFAYFPIAPSNSTRYPEQKELQKAVMSRTLPPKFVEKAHRAREITVDVERLSSYLAADRRVDLLKVDVEGAELEVLHGIDQAHWPLIGQVLLEVQDLDGRLEAVCVLLREHGLEPAVRPAPMVDPDILTHIVHAIRAGESLEPAAGRSDPA
jgi:FkbM family methyltransferase